MATTIRVVTYARVSTIKQETEGQSLDNQERAFVSFLKRANAIRLHAYAESKSAKSIEGREQFIKMLADLPRLRPDFVVVDTIDRFSRNLRDGLDLLERFRSFGISLLPLDWDEPINLSSDRDWRAVVQELTGADYERRRIRNRIVKQYQARRARGATTHSKAPFGLRKDGDVLVPVPELVPVVHGAARLFVNGASCEDVLKYVQRKAPQRAWKTTTGVYKFLRSPEYVKAGLRTLGVQQQIDVRVEANRIRYTTGGRHEHRMAHVFACGLCVALGADPKKVLMMGKALWARVRAWQEVAYSLQCSGGRKHAHRHTQTIAGNSLAAERIFLAILEFLISPESTLVDLRLHDQIEQSWHRVVHRHLIDLAEAEQQYRSRTSELLRSLGAASGETGVLKEALQDLLRADDVAARHREGLLSDLSTGLPTKHQPDADWRGSIAKALDDWPDLDYRRKNDFAVSVCAAIGSWPLLYRNRGFPYVMWITWEEIAPGIVWRTRYGTGESRSVERLTLNQ